MVSRWTDYRTKNGDVLDESFFNNRLKSIDKRVTDLETSLTGLEGQTSGLVRDSIAALNAASAAAQVAFQNTLDIALADVIAAQAQIEDLSDEVTALLGTLGTEFQVDCELGSKVQIRRSATPGAAPLAANLDPGELYINTADRKLFYEDSTGTVRSLDMRTDAADLLSRLLTVDGTGSGLDADKLDGYEASAFALVGHTHTGYAVSSHNHDGVYFPINGTVDGGSY
jgi:hypothetical protein